MLDTEYKERLDLVIEDAKGRDYPEDVYAVALWIGESGSTYTWPQGMKDNRRARVLARIRRYNMEPPVTHGLVIIKKRKA